MADRRREYNSLVLTQRLCDETSASVEETLNAVVDCLQANVQRGDLAGPDGLTEAEMNKFVNEYRKLKGVADRNARMSEIVANLVIQGMDEEDERDLLDVLNDRLEAQREGAEEAADDARVMQVLQTGRTETDRQADAQTDEMATAPAASSRQNATPAPRQHQQLEDGVAVGAEVQSSIDPWTQRPMAVPVQNRHCGHRYDRDTAHTMVKNAQKRRKKLKCPYVGCNHGIPLKIADLVEC